MSKLLLLLIVTTCLTGCNTSFRICDSVVFENEGNLDIHGYVPVPFSDGYKLIDLRLKATSGDLKDD